MEQNNVSEKKDVIIIGGGVSGLVCANMLAMRGLKVALIEMNDKVGGLSQTWKRKLKLSNGDQVEAIFELTHAISDKIPGGDSIYRLFEELGVNWDCIGPLVAAPKFAVFKNINGEEFETYNTIKENIDYLVQKFPKEKKGIKKFFKMMESINEELIPDYRKDGWQKRLEQFIEARINSPLFRAPFYCLTKPTIVRKYKQTYQQYLDDCFQDEDIKILLSTLSGYVGLYPSKASGIVFMITLYVYLAKGGPLAPAKNSYQAMHNELARVFIEKHSGDIRLNSKVTDIIVENKTVKGVEIEIQHSNKKRYKIETDNVVIACDMKKIMLPMKGHLPKKYVKKLENMRMSISCMSVRVIVEMNLFRLKNDLSYAAIVLSSSKRDIDNIKIDDFPDKYILYVNIPTLLRQNANLIKDMQGNSSKKYHIIDIIMTSLPYDTCNRLRHNDRVKYRKLKERYAEQMIEITEKNLIPGLSNAVQYKEVFTAATIERFCGCSEGAIYSFEQTPDQSFPNRFSPRTPIDGLFLTGASILAGGVAGVIAAAKMTTNFILNYIGKN